MKRIAVAAGGMLVVLTVGIALTTSGGAQAGSTAPTVTAVVPQLGPTAGGTLVTVSGTNLFGTTGVTFGGNSASFVNVSNTKLQAISPPGTVGSVDIQVTTGVGTSAVTPLDLFTYVTTPAIQSLRPDEGPTSGKNTVAISGSDFVAPCSVNFGSVASTNVVVVSPTSVVAVAPAGALCTVEVSVACSSGTTPVDPAGDYTYLPPNPAVTSVVFDVGLPAGGETVDVYGRKFMKGATVNFGTNPATNLVWKSASWLEVQVPAGAPGEVDVVVVTSKGASQIVPQDVYLYSSAAP